MTILISAFLLPGDAFGASLALPFGGVVPSGIQNNADWPVKNNVAWRTPNQVRSFSLATRWYPANDDISSEALFFCELVPQKILRINS